MKIKAKQLLLTIAGIVLFDFLFWKEAPGVNTLIFTVFILVATSLNGRASFLQKHRLWVTSGLLMAAVSVALYSSFLSVIGYFGAFLIYMGFSLEPEFRSIFYATPAAITNFILSPVLLIRDVSNLRAGKKNEGKFLRYLKIAAIPLLIIFIFITIYRFADPLFNRIFIEADIVFGKLFGWVLKFLSFGHFIFLVFVAILVCGIIYNGSIPFWKNLESKSGDHLLRRRIPASARLFPLKRMNGLKDENRSANLLFLVLNGILLVVNVTEAIWLARQNQEQEAHVLAENLHEGTWLLLFSILLSIVVLLFFFRRNLNFYPGNKFLVRNAMAWILLNAILALNVAVHDWFYISQYGLTYKRIGVLFFLILVFGGLISMRIKIRDCKSLYYLFRINAWVLYAVIISFSLINWDRAIARYNLEVMKPASQDISLLVHLPARAYPVLERNKGLIFLPKYFENHADSTIFNSYQKRKKWFIRRQQQLGWQSYSLFDRLAYHGLIK
jgi:hypothetical protein